MSDHTATQPAGSQGTAAAAGVNRVLCELLRQMTDVARTLEGEDGEPGESGQLATLIGQADKAVADALAVFGSLGSAAGQLEVIEWINPSPATMPDADTVVLMELQGDGERVFAGSWDGVYWRWLDGMPVKCTTVTGWAHMPRGRAR